MSQKKFFKDLSASTIQIGITQVANLIIFYLISKYISKEEFGFYNWGVALCSTFITILSFGMDLVYVKRVASGIKEDVTIGLHFFHTLFTTVILVVTTIIITSIFPNLLDFKHIFLLILINQSVFSIVNSLKLSLNGLEKFNLLAKIAIITNIIRLLLIGFLFIIAKFQIFNIIITFIVSYLIEFAITYYLSSKNLGYPIKPKLIFKEYKELINESLPQLGTVLFDSALSRLDWILMGIIATSVKTAEYTFAFKIFEVSKLPYLIIAPILLTRFSKLFKQDNKLNITDKSNLDNLFRIEIFIAVLIPIVAISIWSDFFELITNGKYGASNKITYMLLAFCIPLHYASNFLWTMAFTQGQLKKILIITIITSLSNVMLNLLFIPKLNADGAALSYLISTIIQVILYNIYTKQDNYQFRYNFLIIGIVIGILTTLITYWLPTHWVIKGILTITIYIMLITLIKFVTFKTFKSTSI